jgi:hypothetical protein
LALALILKETCIINLNKDKFPHQLEQRKLTDSRRIQVMVAVVGLDLVVMKISAELRCSMMLKVEALRQMMMMTMMVAVAAVSSSYW